MDDEQEVPHITRWSAARNDERSVMHLKGMDDSSPVRVQMSALSPLHVNSYFAWGSNTMRVHQEFTQLRDSSSIKNECLDNERGNWKEEEEWLNPFIRHASDCRCLDKWVLHPGVTQGTDGEINPEMRDGVWVIGSQLDFDVSILDRYVTRAFSCFLATNRATSKPIKNIFGMRRFTQILQQNRWISWDLDL